MKLIIDTDILEKEGWYLHRLYQKDKETMVYETKPISDINTAQPEITLEEVKEYCRKRGLILLTSEDFYSLKHEYQRGKQDGYTQGFRDATVKSKDEDYRWNGGGNY